MTKKHKAFTFITLCITLIFLIIDYFLKSKGLGLRNFYYNLLLSALVYPILALLAWSGIVVYKKYLKKKLFTKIWGLVFMPLILIGLTFTFTLTIFTIKEELVEIDGVSYVYNHTDNRSNVPNVYYEVVNQYFHKIPYAMIDVSPTNP